jgi:Uma2 family endonuclease
MAGDPAHQLFDDEERNSPEVEAAYAAAPERMKAEILEGAFIMMNRPRTEHTSAASRLVVMIGGPFDLGVGGPGGWVIFYEPELHLGRRPDKLGPDLAGWRRARMPKIPRTAEITVTPDWVCEILSPSTRRHDVQVKVPMYLRHGVQHLWLVDPVAQSLQVFRHVTEGWLLALFAEGDERVRAEPFDAFELDLSTLWTW